MMLGRVGREATLGSAEASQTEMSMASVSRHRLGGPGIHFLLLSFFVFPSSLSMNCFDSFIAYFPHVLFTIASGEQLLLLI